MKRLVLGLMVALPCLCCSRVGYEQMFIPDGQPQTDRDAGSQTEVDSWVDAGSDPGVDAGGDDVDAGTDAEDAGVIDAGGDDAEDAGVIDASGVDGGDDAADIDGGEDAGDPGPWTCRSVESYVESFSIISTSFVYVDGSEISFTPESPDENWLLMVSAAMMSDYSGPAEVEANYTINGVEKGVGGFRPDDPWMEGAWQHFVLITGTTDPQVVRVGLREGLEGYQATINRLRVIALPLPASADVHYVGADDIQPVAPTVWNTYLELEVNPISEGTYLVMSSVSAHEDPGTNSVGVRLADPAGMFWPEANPAAGDHQAHYSNHRYPWRSFFVARTQNPDTASTYQVQASGSDNNGGSEIFYRRLLAFRTNAFSSFHAIQNLPTVSNATTTPLAVSTLAVSPNPQGCPQVAIQSMFVWSGQAGDVFYLSGYTVDGTPVASYSESFGIASSFCAPFGVFHLLTADSTAQLENRLWVQADGPEGMARESVIHVLGL